MKKLERNDKLRGRAACDGRRRVVNRLADTKGAMFGWEDSSESGREFRPWRDAG